MNNNKKTLQKNIISPMDAFSTKICYNFMVIEPFETFLRLYK